MRFIALIFIFFSLNGMSQVHFEEYIPNDVFKVEVIKSEHIISQDNVKPWLFGNSLDVFYVDTFENVYYAVLSSPYRSNHWLQENIDSIKAWKIYDESDYRYTYLESEVNDSTINIEYIGEFQENFQVIKNNLE